MVKVKIEEAEVGLFSYFGAELQSLLFSVLSEPARSLGALAYDSKEAAIPLWLPVFFLVYKRHSSTVIVLFL